MKLIAAGLEHCEADFGKVGDLLLASLFGDLLHGDPRVRGKR